LGTIGANVFLLHSVPPNSLVIYEEVNVKITQKKNKARGDGDFQI
jgi:serine O-acetyltransferase